MRHVRPAMLAISLALLGALVGGAEARAPAADPVVSCDRIVLRTRAPEDGNRVLLGAVSLPEARHLAADATAAADRRWRWYRNGGLAVRARTSDVTVSVPEGWRDRAAVSWGGSRASHSVTFARCGSAGAGHWNWYSGGFHLRARGDCVPLLVTVGGMSTTVRLGIGRACGGV